MYTALGASLVNAQTVLLLYTLIHSSSQFKAYVLVRSDPDVIVLPLLKLLDTHRDLPASQTYMLLILLLILSEDPAFGKNVHKLMLGLQQNTLAALANLAPTVTNLTGYAAQRIVALADVLVKR